MKTFIRAVEYWVPGHDRTMLEFGGGLYGGAPRFGARSKAMVFGRGEGLPGRAWAQRQPLIFKNLNAPAFLRAQAAADEGLTCGIALPIFAGDILTSVLVIFCGDDAAHAGAIELWRNDPATPRDLALADGYYGTTGDAFELVSRSTSLRKGHGLPGMAWEAAMPVFVEDLGRSQRFLRADSAEKVGINRGFALPCSLPGEAVWVLAFLSALATPIARRLEVWEPDAARTRLVRSGGFCEARGQVPSMEDSGAGIEHGQGALGLSFLSGTPAVSAAAQSEPGAIGAAAAEAGVQSLVALPVLRDGRVAAVVGWYF